MNTYSGPSFMKHPELGIDLDEIGPLLPLTLLQALQDQTLKVTFWHGNGLN